MRLLLWLRFGLLPEMFMRPETSLDMENITILFSDTQVSVNAGLHSEASLLDAAKRSLSVTASPYCAHLWVSHSSGRHVGLDV